MLFWLPLICTLYFVIELIYISIARRFGILDKPNLRSSHKKVTVRGGGVIFTIAALLFLPYSITSNLIFGISLLVISVLSFIDDIRDVDSIVRLVIQNFSVVGLLYSLDISLHWLSLPILFVLITGIINAYNFMDGINGITVLYSIITIICLFWVSVHIENIQTVLFFVSVLAGLGVFAFFNLRNKAICFAGDVGSVAMAFIICFLILKLSIQTGFIFWVLFLGVYGIDTVFTILCRFFRKEPLMVAHRSHFYQYLANERGWSHIQVSIVYAVAQLILNLIVLYAYLKRYDWIAVLTLFGFFIIYSIFRFRLEGKKRLFVSYNVTN